MEVKSRSIIIGLLGAMLSVLTAADIMVQPGYREQSQPSQQVPNKSGRLQNSAQQPELTLEEELERYRTLNRNIEEQLVHLINEQNSQNGVLGYPLILHPRVIHPLLPHIGGGRLFSLTPAGAHGLHVGGYGIRRHPLLLGESADSYRQQGNGPARSQWTRSVTGGPGLDDRLEGKVHDVATNPTVDGIGNLSEIRAADESMADKLVESRQVGGHHDHQDDAAIVGSPLEKIHYESPRNNNDQHHPNMMKGVKAVADMIDAAVGSINNKENNDIADGNESQRFWKAGYSMNNEPITEQRSSGNRFSHQQAPATYPASSSAINPKNWLTTSHRNNPSEAQNYYQGQPSGSYPSHSSYPGGPTWNSGTSGYPSGATSSATANANNGFSRPGYNQHGSPSGYPSGATSSATANASNGFSRPGYNQHGSPSGYPSGATSSATANASNEGYRGPGYSYPSGATSSATANANNYSGGPTNSATASATSNSGQQQQPQWFYHPYRSNGATSSATANPSNEGYSGPGYSYPSGATSSTTANGNNYSGGPTNSTTTSATSNSGQQQQPQWFYHPYRSNNAYTAYTPYAKYVDQFGRALQQRLPSTISRNSGYANAAYYNPYLQHFVQNQMAAINRQTPLSYSYY